MAQITFLHPVRSQVVDGAMTYVYAPIDLADEGAVKHFVATYNRALRTMGGNDAMTATIHLGERTSDRYNDQGELLQIGGWLEHTIVIKEGERHYMTIGAIQRSATASSEFHS